MKRSASKPDGYREWRNGPPLQHGGVSGTGRHSAPGPGPLAGSHCNKRHQCDRFADFRIWARRGPPSTALGSCPSGRQIISAPTRPSAHLASARLRHIGMSVDSSHGPGKQSTCGRSRLDTRERPLPRCGDRSETGYRSMRSPRRVALHGALACRTPIGCSGRTSTFDNLCHVGHTRSVRGITGQSRL
jgi:hypothetical protein